MKRCKTHGQLRPCPQCAQAGGYGGPGRGQGRKSPLTKPVRVLVTLEHAELQEALRHHPGSRAAAVRSIFLEGLAAHSTAENEAAQSDSSTATASVAEASASPAATSQVVDRRTRRLQKSFALAYSDLLALERLAQEGRSLKILDLRINSVRGVLSKIIAQIRKESRKGVVPRTWFRRDDAPIHTDLAEPLNHQPRSWSIEEDGWEFPSMLHDLAAAAQAVEEGNYMGVIESLIPRIRHRLTLVRRY